jgi:hypothetical protein
MEKFIPFFMTIFERLNPSIQAHVVASVDRFLVETDETNIFGVGASMEKYSWALVIGELFLFQSLAILPLMCANPLALVEDL